MNSQSSSPNSTKRTALVAKQKRLSIVPRVAEVFQVSNSEVRFADEAKTVAYDVDFANRLKTTEVQVVSSRVNAICLARERCDGWKGPGVWLIDDFHLVGAIEVELETAFDSLDGMLKEQGEFVRLMSVDGQQGLCISTEEGKGGSYERHVVIWG